MKHDQPKDSAMSTTTELVCFILAFHYHWFKRALK